MKIRLEDSDIPIQLLLKAGKELLAIAEDGRLLSLTDSSSHGPAGQWVELCPNNTLSNAYWLYSEPSWNLLGFQKHLYVGSEVINFYRIHEAVKGKDCLLAAKDDKVLDFTFQEPDPGRYGTSWTWGDNDWEWDVIKRHIANN
jgi:hypothetical protein